MSNRDSHHECCRKKALEPKLQYTTNNSVTSFHTVIITAWLTGGMSLFICGFVCVCVNKRSPWSPDGFIIQHHVKAHSGDKPFQIHPHLCYLSFFILVFMNCHLNILMSTCHPQHLPTDLRGTSLKARSVVLALSRLEALQPSPRHIRKPLAPFVLFLLCWAVCGRSSRHGFSLLK